MKIRSAIIVFCIMAFFASPVYAVNTVSAGNKVLTITAIDSDYSWTTNYVRGQLGKIKHIMFVPGQAAERMVLREGSLTGRKFFDSGACADTSDVKILYLNDWIEFFMEYDDCVIGSASSTLIIHFE